jgi:hypothetical protein
MSDTDDRLRLTAIFETLPFPKSDHRLLAFSSFVLGAGPHRLGKDARGAPALLVATASTGVSSRPAPIELEHVRVQYHVRCLLWHAPTSSEEATFTLVHCRSADRLLREYFLSVLEGVLPRLGASPSEARVREVIDTLTELFRALMMPSRKSVQGLWAELFLMSDVEDTCALAQAWHATPGEPYDFTVSRQRIEVKSAAGPERRHHFTLEQLHPPAGTRALVASVFTERAGGGVSLGELLDKVRSRVAGEPDLLLRIDQVVAASLGQSWQKALDDRFDWERAQDSLVFYTAESIPSISPDLPTGVSDVRFMSDLSNVTPIQLEALREAGGLFQAAASLRGVRRL